ncbi:hypothetical protein [Oceanobacillus halotolerans]|uniref:hypothetical protein n=1 Tax=Oceanobacillus halotolerans TaxID=2663380 RepID=UPI0013DB7ECF|nr:hypothetical protein [Oceanobacillus halotolerans]
MRLPKTIVILLMLVLIVGCMSPFGFEEEDVTEIRVSEFEDFGQINGSDEEVYTSEDEINLFVTALNTAHKEDGSVDIARGDFDIRIILDDGTEDGFHLWLADELESGIIMHVDDTHTIYTLTDEATEQLKDLLL